MNIFPISFRQSKGASLLCFYTLFMYKIEFSLLYHSNFCRMQKHISQKNLENFCMGKERRIKQKKTNLYPLV